MGSASSPRPAVRRSNGRLSKAERRQMRRQTNEAPGANSTIATLSTATDDTESLEMDSRFAKLMAKKEDMLLGLVAQINNVYQDKLKKPAPFMTFVLCGMQSAGKSTIMERFMNEVINIVSEGTGTRCPLDTTCIHDDRCDEPRCELSGDELDASAAGVNLSTNEVFTAITNHNKALGDKDAFSTVPLRLTIRSKRVQNMRFVDTPGIISTHSVTGVDNRQEIKKILTSEISKPNTKLCVLLEPKDLEGNPIVNFCDETFGNRAIWATKATFLMTKFDQRLGDFQSAEKANGLYNTFISNKFFPHLVITPTLPKEKLPPDELYKLRKELLDKADDYEAGKFSGWRQGHRGENEEDLKNDICERIGFSTAKTVMREIMFKDTVHRLPEVLASLRADLETCEVEKNVLLKKKQLTDPQELKFIVQDVLLSVENKLIAYLDGDLQSARKFPHALQTLDDEIEEEDDSEWASRELNHHTEHEDHWRDKVAEMNGSYPESIQASKSFLGGKQYQRAIEFFRVVMIDSLPDPFELEGMAANATGYLGGGLQRENWERAMVQIIRVCMKDVSHPGINYLIKHVGSIFRRLYLVAMDDIKQGEQFSTVFQQLPQSVERHLSTHFDDMLWDLLSCASKQTHSSLEPMFSTVDPNLPTFHAEKLDDNDDDERDKRVYYVKDGDSFVHAPDRREVEKEGMVDAMTRRMTALVSGSGKSAVSFMKEEHNSRAMKKNYFLPDERTAMITDKETQRILQRSFEYMVALMDFNLVLLKFQLNYYLYEGFKEKLKSSFSRRIADATDWATLVEVDPDVDDRLAELEEQIEGLRQSLQEVQRIQRKLY
jgi:Dynamin family